MTYCWIIQVSWPNFQLFHWISGLLFYILLLITVFSRLFPYIQFDSKSYERKIFKKRQGSRISLNFIEVIGADRKIVYCVWMVDEDVLFNETWIDENWKQRGKKKLKRKRETNEFISHMRSAWSYIVQFDGKISLFSHKKRCQKSFSVLIEPRGCTTAPKQNV